MRRKVISLSLPAPLVERIEKIRQAESQTRSELIRAALRLYFKNFEKEVKSGARKRKRV
ncbi:ribbon-helix-helix protein, CopG family [Candidatus Parcubacteria bacterium]|nr:MAG: ribbon-helix-helix protein, CopG family [Candidatus Parcubacteria bacterium]